MEQPKTARDGQTVPARRHGGDEGGQKKRVTGQQRTDGTARGVVQRAVVALRQRFRRHDVVGVVVVIADVARPHVTCRQEHEQPTPQKEPQRRANPEGHFFTATRHRVSPEFT
jgi:hypothetical protein